MIKLKKNSKVVLAYSGGLDSTLIMTLLKTKYKYNEVIPVLVDVGQGEDEIQIARERADTIGEEVIFFDSKVEFVKDYIHRCIKANGSYEGYPIGTSMSRVLIATKVVEVANKNEADAVAHGCTGKGNDQFRMENVFGYLAPDTKIIAPIRELDLSRPKEEELLRKEGIDPKRKKGKLGGDINMWSHSIGSGQVEDLKSRFEEDYIWAVQSEKAPDRPTELKLTFKEGVPIELDGIKNPVEIILRLNEVGGSNGIGRIDMLEDGILNLKSRELYEAPAATILLRAHADLEHLTLTKEQLRLKHEIDRLWADMVYHAMWLHPLRKDLDAFIDSSQKNVSGDITLRLYKSNIDIINRVSSKSLFVPELRSIKKGGGFDQREATAAVKIYSMPYRLYGTKNR